MSDMARVPGRPGAWTRERDPLALLLLGILAVLAGILAIVYPLAGGVAVTTIFGIVLIVAAIAHLVHAISARQGAWSVPSRFSTFGPQMPASGWVSMN